ncbi:hypothetical protein OpiT1DRAFT_03282 [Opitutaceae bacterium TAV1]|nr:hypothetical protein OpiT1DRAFT_03282 [Opitutaceae bacterium TAV1]
MSNCFTNWDGDDWQKHITTLLNLRYGARYTAIPDKDQGDWGLEGFSHDGVAYQCYAAQEPLSTADLTEKQRDKITRDIKKFCDNSQDLARILGQLRIEVWGLVVPRCNSKHLLVHAETKAAEVRNRNLGIVAPAFRISVMTDEAFQAERAKLACDVAQKLPVNVRDIPDLEVDNWSTQNTSLNSVLTSKLRKLNCSTEVQNSLKTQLIRHFLEGQNLLQFFHDNYPEVYEQLQSCKSNRERIVKTNSLLNNSSAPIQVKGLFEEYQCRILEDVKAVNASNADILAYEAIADWLIRCPLDFPQPSPIS